MITPKADKKDLSIDDEEDEFDARIRRTGCFEKHEALQECYLRTKDWRECRDEMLAFKKCYAAYEQSRKEQQQQ